MENNYTNANNMNIKSERTRANARVVKILNDEKINMRAPIASIIASVPLSPTKQITKSIATIKPIKRAKRDANMDHYMLHTVKGEADAEGYVGETIDFILTDDAGEDVLTGPSGEITEELHLSGDEFGEGDDHTREGEMKTEEIIEHVCGKCYKTFRRVNGLKKHLDFCRFDSGYSLRKAEMCKNLDKIEKDAVIMDNKDLCFCCGESYDTCHLGHISCPDCPKSFKTQSSYERHIFITHSEFNDFPCSICNAKMRSQNLLNLHIEQHQNRGKPYACKICGKDFTRSYHLKRHQKYSSCSADQSDAMHCKVCDKVFFRLDNLRAHLKQHLGDNTTKKAEYTCAICKNCFYSLSTLNIHTRTHTGERPYDCDLCDKKFPSLVALKKHRRYHTGEKPYTCSVCGQSFAVKEVLNRHMKRHTGERPHACDVCKKSFIQATQLRSHLRTHLRPFKCTVCSEAFKTEKQLQRHEKTHREKTRKVRQEIHCKTCNIFFRRTHTMMRHLKTKQHLSLEEKTKNKRTDCAICEKNFDTVQNLEFHILKVHEVDPEDFINARPSDSHEEAILPEPNIQFVKVEKDISMVDQLIGSKVELISPKSNVNSGGSNNAVVVQEFLVDELPSTSNATQQIFLNNDAFTIIPLNSDDLIEEKTLKNSPPTIAQTKDAKMMQRKSLAESLAAAIADEEEVEEDAAKSIITNEEDEMLNENVSKLLDMLVDKKTLKKFGWPQNSVENVLCKVIENCGHDLSQDSEEYKNCDFTTRMREYVKLLFTVVIQNDSIKELLNNYPIDEVIEYVLGNDDDDDDNESNDISNDMEQHNDSSKKT